jgi:hypothetical protein
MGCEDPSCLGNYDFEHIVSCARKRFVEGYSTIELMEQARSVREKQEIALVSLLDVEDDRIRDLRLRCIYEGECKVIDCRDKLKKMIEEKLAIQK